MGAARAVVEAEGLHLIAELRERGRGGGTGQSRADDDDLELTLVRRADELGVVLEVGPLLLDRTFGDFGVKNHDRGKVRLVAKGACRDTGGGLYQPQKNGRRDGSKAEEDHPSDD